MRNTWCSRGLEVIDGIHVYQFQDTLYVAYIMRNIMHTFLNMISNMPIWETWICIIVILADPR